MARKLPEMDFNETTEIKLRLPVPLHEWMKREAKSADISIDDMVRNTMIDWAYGIRHAVDRT